MILSLRIARLGRAAALVAGFLAVAGSFGLHPEPQRVAPAAAVEAQWSAPAGNLETSPHVCLACLAHRSIPLPRLSAVDLTPRPAASASPSAAPAPLARLESHPREGRAPPALI